MPTSAGAFAPGQEKAPAALRAAGLLEMLSDAGIDVSDHGDRDIWRWRPDRNEPRAQNLDQVVAIVEDTARRVAAVLDRGEVPLVLGGDCTVGIGTIAAGVAAGGTTGVVYFDAHADLNVPGSVTEGALDWMGLAHMLGEKGTADALAEVGGQRPLLAPEQVVLLGWDPGQATDHERDAIERLQIAVVPAEEVSADPEGAAARALQPFEGRSDRVVVHFDVDVIDFTDTPLSENWGRNQGLSYADTQRVLRSLLASPRLSGLTVTEMNPDHVEEGSDAVARFARDLAAALADQPGGRLGPWT